MLSSTNSQVTKQIAFWDREGAHSESQCTLPTKEFLGLVGNNSRILEVGCGTGRVLAVMLGYVHPRSLFGVDWSHASVCAAKARLGEVELCTGDCRYLPYQDQSFDSCILSALLTCFISTKDLLHVVKETYRVVKPLGIVFISDFLLNMSFRNLIRYAAGFVRYRSIGAFWAGQPFRHFRYYELHKLLSSVGFQVINTKIISTRSWHGHLEKGVYFVCRKNSSHLKSQLV